MAEATRPTAAIVSVGNELLYGQTVDTNAAWLGRWLGARGVRVERGFTVGDVTADIVEALSRALASADLVVVSGGLGPTPDDVTKAAVASHLGLALVQDAEVQARLLRHFGAEGFGEIPIMSRGQAEVPAGARTLANPLGTAPGLVLEAGNARVVLLPGVPSELHAIVDGGLADLLDDWLRGRPGVHPSHHVVVHTTGIRETRLAEALEARLAGLAPAVTDGISIAYLPDARGVDLRLTSSGTDRLTAIGRIGSLLEALASTLDPYRFESPSGDLAEAVVHGLRAGGHRLAVAESCTGGLLGARLTATPGASDVFAGGVIAYENAVKTGLLGVPEADLARDGAVSEVVARHMAEGVARRLGTSTALSITGVAGPGGGSPEKPVGTVWIGLALRGETGATCHHFSGDRGLIRERAAQAALFALYGTLASGAARP